MLSFLLLVYLIKFLYSITQKLAAFKIIHHNKFILLLLYLNFSIFILRMHSLIKFGFLLIVLLILIGLNHILYLLRLL